MQQPADILRAIWAPLGLPDEALAQVALTGGEPVLPSSFRVDVAAQVSIAALAAAAASLWRRRGGGVQRITVDLAAASAEFRSERLYRLNGETAPQPWDAIAGAYRCGDGRWIRVHTILAHHRDGLLGLLGAAPEREAVKRAVLDWSAERLERIGSERGLVLAMGRSFAEWDSLPQAAAVAATPLVEIRPLGYATRRVASAAARPLAGIRVLDLTRIIAGPVCGRALAAHGADVLRLIAPTSPTMPAIDIDTGRGKRSAHVDLTTGDGRATLRRLIGEADVFVQAYRPGALAALGFGPAEVAALRPGIVHASLSAYGEDGPWGGKRGFDSLVQTATGFNHAEAAAAGQETPCPLPCQALDHASGYLMALGVLAALHRQTKTGGGWRVRVSLARTGHWLRGLGRLPFDASLSPPAAAELETSASGYGTLQAVRHAARMTLTPPRWDAPSVPWGTHAAAWRRPT